MVNPLKQYMRKFRKVEDRIWRAVCERFNLEPRLIDDVKEWDLRALVTERRDLLRQSSHRWSDYLEQFKPFPENIKSQSSTTAESNFLMEFGKLRAA